MSEELSAYELQRLENIKKNDAMLKDLGLDAMKTKAAVKRKKPVIDAVKKPPPPPPSRSSRSRGPPPELMEQLPAELDNRAFGDGSDDEQANPFADKLKRASNAPRLTAEQTKKLEQLEPVSSLPLSAAELAALDEARAELRNAGGSGGWKAHAQKGTSLWAEKREILQRVAREHGLRWPEWLGRIQAALPPMGSTEAARDQTMFGIEKAACGLGLGYKDWPEGVGVLLAHDEEESESNVPRLLTLGADTETLRREGQRLEQKFGRDAGNGWVYNHALGKLRKYQEMLLRETWDEEPSDQSIAELEQEGLRPGAAPGAALRAERSAEQSAEPYAARSAEQSEEESAQPSRKVAKASVDDSPEHTSPELLPFTVEVVRRVLASAPLEELDGKKVREALEREVGVARGAFKPFKAKIHALIDEHLAALL